MSKYEIVDSSDDRWIGHMYKLVPDYDGWYELQTSSGSRITSVHSKEQAMEVMENLKRNEFYIVETES